MAIIFYCHRCNKKGEFETKKEMHCDCGHYTDSSKNISDYINMRKTWSNTTKVEFNTTTMDKDIAERNRR
tara:strand:- start:5284 stop:5493 length:210 start_codon:yes stop_codon:yes gene_type:complete